MCPCQSLGSFLSGRGGKAEVKRMFALSWNPRISMHKFTGHCKNNPSGREQVHIAQITAEFGPASEALGNCLGGSFYKEYRLV